jgi:dihydrodipicolinate synthase/N-acetylneuraminate lyase
MLAREACRGVWVPLVTPFRREEFDPGAMRELVEWLCTTGIGGFLVLGTTGEAAHVTDAEGEEIIRTVVRAAGGRVPVLAGSGRPATVTTIAATRCWADAGAEGVFALTPFIYRARMDPEALRRHYTALADRAPIPVFVYHMPDQTGLDLEADLLVDLVAHPNIWGFKDSSGVGGPLAEALRRAPTIGFVGHGARLLEGLAAGAAGGILAAAHLIPEICVRIEACWRAGDHRGAEEAQRHATVLTHALRGWTIPGVKYGLAWRGMPGGEPRRPLAPPPPDVEERIAAALSAALAAAPETAP